MNDGPQMQLRDKVCLIAGASGAIGRAVAQAFHQQGARLALTYLTQKQNGSASFGPNVNVLEVPLDVCQREQVEGVIRQTIERFGTIDVLVNCTGVLGPVGPTSQVREQDWVRALEINLVGSFYLTRAVLPAMLKQGRGKIIHFSGGGAAYARPYYTAYSASKAGLVRFIESLAEELRDAHIDINAIAPGPVKSRMWDEMRNAKDADPKTIEELKKMDETGGVPPDRAAALAVFLAAERSNGLTGRLISAVYDKWDVFDQKISEIMRSEAGTLRRVPLG